MYQWLWRRNFFDNIKNHYKDCNPNNIKNIKALSKKQVEEYRKNNSEEIGHLKSN